MKTFRTWFEEVSPTAADDPTLVANASPVDVVTAPEQKITTKQYLEKYKLKPWKASKEQILGFWKTLSPGAPIAIKPIPYDHEGSTIQEDTVRITGSKEFISSVLTRLKDFLNYENQDTKIMAAYRQSPRSFLPGNKNSYIFYLQVMERGKN
jgi:hypothetical protein